MASPNLTDYELKRLENIRRNKELMASLKLQSMATQLTSAKKRPRAESKPKTIQNPTTEIRRCNRFKGIPPDSFDSKDLGPISMREVYTGASDRVLIDTLLGNEKKKSQLDYKLESLSLDPENIARVVPENITNMRFFPSSNLRMVVVGNKVGNVGFWNIDSKEEEEEEGSGVYKYRPHSRPISGISVQQHCMSKVFTSSYDGFIRLMDAEKEVFDLVYASDKNIYSLSQQADNPKCLYFGEGGRGGLSLWDERTGDVTARWSPHDGRINSVDFNSGNSNIIATSSTDGTACIWDLRCADVDKLRSLKTIRHERAVHSAYFSPSGRSLVTTSLDDTVRISSGANFEDVSIIHHDNASSRWTPNFKAIWGWDDAYVFIGNKNRGVNVISPLQRTTIYSLKSPHMSAIPCILAAHPFNVGMLAGATGGGQVYVWTLGQETHM